MPLIFLAAYIIALVCVTVILLALIVRFVRAHERIALALERIAHAPRRDDR